MSTELQSPGKRSPNSNHAPVADDGAANDTVRMDSKAHASDHSPTIVSSPPSAPRRRSFALSSIFWLMQIAAAAAAGYWVAEQNSSAQHKIDLTIAPPKQTLDVVPVTTQAVAMRDVERGIDAVGNLHGYDELTLKTKVSGRVAKVYHDFADKVAPGELIMEIDPTDAQLAVEQARRSLASELAKWGFEDVPEEKTDLKSLPTVVASRLKAELTKSQLQRLTTLQSRGSVIAEEIDQARTNSLVAESEYANQLLMARSGAATARLKKAELDTAMQQLAECKIYVPVTSTLRPDAHYTITQRMVTSGDWLAAGADLVRLVVDETLKLRLTVPEKHAGRVKVGQKVEVTAMSQSAPAVGVVARIGPAVDSATRTFQVEAEIPNADSALKTGGFAKARIVVSDDTSAQTVPISALVSFAGVHKIFLAERDQVKEVQVTLGYQTDQWVEITSPRLPASALVVTSGQSKLADGSTVRIRTAEEIAAEQGQSEQGQSDQSQVISEKQSEAAIVPAVATEAANDSREGGAQ